MRTHLQHKLVVALVGTVLPLPRGFDDHADLVARLKGGHGLHRRTEIADVEATAQTFGQRSLQELNHQGLALLANIDANFVVRQGHHDSPGIVRTTAKVDILERQGIAISALCKHRRNGGRWQ